ncbi:MAG: hypothetical protein O3B79_07075 [Crenarchaeota archaeon]|nr:hypothetical protein [Thermoproteota archaeon]HJJ24870.1 hypothetical protein [Nitrosopumilus sp.]
MKLLHVVLIIGIVILFIGFMIPINETYRNEGMYVGWVGLLLIIGSIVALARRRMSRMVKD